MKFKSLLVIIFLSANLASASTKECSDKELLKMLSLAVGQLTDILGSAAHLSYYIVKSKLGFTYSDQDFEKMDSLIAEQKSKELENRREFGEFIFQHPQCNSESIQTFLPKPNT